MTERFWGCRRWWRLSGSGREPLLTLVATTAIDVNPPAPFRAGCRLLRRLLLHRNRAHVPLRASTAALMRASTLLMSVSTSFPSCR